MGKAFQIIHAWLITAMVLGETAWNSIPFEHGGKGYEGIKHRSQGKRRKRARRKR